MSNDNKKIYKLLVKLYKVEKQQNKLSDEIKKIKLELDKLQTVKNVKHQIKIVNEDTEPDKAKHQSSLSLQKEKIKEFSKKKKYTFSLQADIEKFIGESLISKIGIIIILIGIAIGIRYSIERGMITPVIRILLGYIAGLGFLTIGWNLKKKYKNYSEVLMSGAMSTMYFTTFFAYDFYEMLPHIVAFALMLIFIAFTVYTAFNYNNQIIAHIGLVGAYAIPFLLSKNSDNITVLFIYMAIINFGVLAIAFKKYWQPLYYVSSGATWLIFAAWYWIEHNNNINLTTTLFFLFLFFFTAYFTFIIYKLRWKKQYLATDILILLTNSFVFYGLGYIIFSNSEILNNYIGLFTLFNSVIHSAVGLVIFNRKVADKNLFFLTVGLVIIFATITVPVQFTGNWVTLLWAGEAALLFLIGRISGINFYEKSAYSLMLLSFAAIIKDWSVYIETGLQKSTYPIINFNFLSSLIFVLFFATIVFIDKSKKHSHSKDIFKSKLAKTLIYLPAFILIISIYFLFRLEISLYFNKLYNNSLVITAAADYHNQCYRWFNAVWLINYSILFLTILSYINLKRIKSNTLGKITLLLNVIIILFFILKGLGYLAELRDYYLQQPIPQYYSITSFNIIIRYISYLSVALLFAVSIIIKNQDFIKEKIKVWVEIFIYISVLWIISSEFINILKIFGNNTSNKLGLSILWGIYSLYLIILGIWKNKKHLRLTAFILFGITLIKLLFYDLSHLSTEAKTIVFVLLGIILLIISFLYNKYSHIISEKTE